MLLKEWDWDNQREVETDYPDELIRDFMNFVRRNNQWQDNPVMMRERVRHLERDLTEHHNNELLREAERVAALSSACTAETATGQPCKVDKGIVDGLCHIHRRSLVTA